MLRLEDVHTFYGPIEALKGISLEVNQGEIACLIGSNGAGKSTTLMTISGILRPEKGKIYFNGGLLNCLPPHVILGLGICQIPEGRRIFPRLTVRENLEMGGFKNRKEVKANLEKIFSLFPVLKERERQAGGTLSGGEQQMLAIARALMSSPKVLLLDEPSLGLAPIMVSKIYKVIREINREGVTILLVEQNAKAALRLSQRGYVLEHGRIILHDTGESLLHNEQVRAAYLGE
jgi:branched-chain amino acid transport system ATP-binding protein